MSSNCANAAASSQASPARGDVAGGCGKRARKARFAGGAAALLALAACEAPLNLDGVERQMAEPVRRSDQFQAATTDGRTLVVVADVSGHNLASGMLMVNARSTLKTIAACSDDRRSRDRGAARAGPLGSPHLPGRRPTVTP